MEQTIIYDRRRYGIDGAASVFAAAAAARK